MVIWWLWGCGLVCEPVIAQGQPTGWELCPTAGRFPPVLYRTSAAACAQTPGLEGARLSCEAHERCLPDHLGGCRCVLPCTTDADCLDDAACACGVSDQGQTLFSGNYCLASECTGPGDCGGFDCGLAVDPCGGAHGLYCRSDRDQCVADRDCGWGRRCTFSAPEERWGCSPEPTCH